MEQYWAIGPRNDHKWTVGSEIRNRKRRCTTKDCERSLNLWGSETNRKIVGRGVQRSSRANPITRNCLRSIQKACLINRVVKVDSKTSYKITRKVKIKSWSIKSNENISERKTPYSCAFSTKQSKIAENLRKRRAKTNKRRDRKFTVWFEAHRDFWFQSHE